MVLTAEEEKSFWKLGGPMADCSSGSFHSDTSNRRHKCNSFFPISGSRVGFGAKGLSSDSESAWSPTSPLDFKLFSSLSNPFTVRSSRPSSQNGHKKQSDCTKVGLRIINSLVEETKINGEIHGPTQRKNIIFGPLVKTGILISPSTSPGPLAYVKSNSLPKNYVISHLPETTDSNSKVPRFDDISRIKELPLERQVFKNIMTLPDSAEPSSSSIDSSQILNLGINHSCEENASSAMSSVAERSSPLDYSLDTKSSSVPTSIDFSNGHIGSLSAKDIELSEDYTCIISYGPNPKRTHIFGDRILECHENDLTQFSLKEEPMFRTPQVSTFSEGPDSYPSDNIFSFCYSCKKKIEQGKDIHIYSGEKAFCNLNCQSEGTFADEELEKTNNESAMSSPDSSYDDNIFLMMAK